MPSANPVDDTPSPLRAAKHVLAHYEATHKDDQGEERVEGLRVSDSTPVALRMSIQGWLGLIGAFVVLVVSGYSGYRDLKEEIRSTRADQTAAMEQRKDDRKATDDLIIAVRDLSIAVTELRVTVRTRDERYNGSNRVGGGTP